ncbi:MAG TPA: hypothetical protein VIG06_08790 [Kofleriaceae bacterium]
MTRILAVAGGTLALALAGCASSPVALEVSPPAELVIGGQHQLKAIVVNRGREELRFEEGGELQYMLLCRTPKDRPGVWGIGTGSGVSGGVWGGCIHCKVDPDDPLFCRSHPPSTVALPPGGSLPLEITIETSRRCVAGEGELEVGFVAHDFGRKCPGIFYGKTAETKRAVRLRRDTAAGAIAPSASPKVLECALSAPGEPEALSIRLRNPTAEAWRGRVVASLELRARSDPDVSWWSPVELATDSQLPATGTPEAVEIAPGSELRRDVALRTLSWEGPGLEVLQPLTAIDGGTYDVTMELEVLGGESWEFRCAETAVEIPAPTRPLVKSARE